MARTRATDRRDHPDRPGFIRQPAKRTGTRTSRRSNGQEGWQLPQVESASTWQPPAPPDQAGTVLRSNFNRTPHAQPAPRQRPDQASAASMRQQAQAGGAYRGDPNALDHDPRGELTSPGTGLGRDPLLLQQQYEWEQSRFTQGGGGAMPNATQMPVFEPPPTPVPVPSAPVQSAPVAPRAQPVAQHQLVLSTVEYAHVDQLWDWIRADSARGQAFFMRPIQHSIELNDLIRTLINGEQAGTSVLRAIVWGPQLMGFVLLAPIMSTERVAMLHTYLAPEVRAHTGTLLTTLIPQLASFVPGHRLALLNGSADDIKALEPLGFKVFTMLVR